MSYSPVVRHGVACAVADCLTSLRFNPQTHSTPQQHYLYAGLSVKWTAMKAQEFPILVGRSCASTLCAFTMVISSLSIYSLGEESMNAIHPSVHSPGFVPALPVQGLVLPRVEALSFLVPLGFVARWPLTCVPSLRVYPRTE